MNESSRTQGGLICIAVAVLAALFLLGVAQQSYWALAIPIAPKPMTICRSFSMSSSSCTATSTLVTTEPC